VISTARVEGYKKPVPQALIERVWDLVASGMQPGTIGKVCGISTEKADQIASMKDCCRASVIASGAAARPGTKCPYSIGEIGLRSAWLAGHYDRHGFQAWEKAQ
jgi:hypothetical protein